MCRDAAQRNEKRTTTELAVDFLSLEILLFVRRRANWQLADLSIWLNKPMMATTRLAVEMAREIFSYNVMLSPPFWGRKPTFDRRRKLF